MAAFADDLTARSLRRRLVARLIEHGHAQGRVAAAFESVPRHVFVPDIDVAEAYRDEALPTKWDAAGRAISSSSQPTIMAIMLTQLEVQAGQHVLEVGTGTGFNAALLAELVGSSGTVTTVDVDPELTDVARRRLSTGGYGNIEVVTGDGGYGWSSSAPYDRVIVTAGAGDLPPAWSEQLVVGGRLVVPLSLGGPQYSIAFVRHTDRLESDSVQPCGFMPMHGDFEAPRTGGAADPDDTAARSGALHIVARLGEPADRPDLPADRPATVDLPHATLLISTRPASG